MQPEILCYNTVIIGSGAAGFNCALQLHRLGVNSLAIVTEGVNMGTSRNTGSDKQTYYKLSLGGEQTDSPREMAKDLFNGKAVDGDVAYAEAALSSKCFYSLVNLGVPFPQNRYGEYIGYQTDHDFRERATSAGPLTSKMMTEVLECAVRAANIEILDKTLAISVIKDNHQAVGLLCVKLDESKDFLLINAKNIVFATGGPAGIYQDTVYPFGHTGSSGIAVEAGITLKNLTEWQYGLASTSPRWNVSGSYMQVLPRFVSVESDGTEHEFLSEYFASVASGEKALSRLLFMTFKKGYEWPFDCLKVMNGSSIIDLLVYREKNLLGRRVYLDFTKNPESLEDIPYQKLDAEALSYLKNSNCCFGKPIDRLIAMNEPAYQLYLEKGVDLKCEMLEIALSAQHNNGGLDIDMWWQTNLEGVFCAGEACASHGVYRPGGSALNAGQVGSLRAAEFISENRKGSPLAQSEFLEIAAPTLQKHKNLIAKALSDRDNLPSLIKEVRETMSKIGGAIRNLDEISKAIPRLEELILNFDDTVKIKSKEQMHNFYRLRDLLFTACTMLYSVKNYAENGGKSRGSAIYSAKDGEAPIGFGDSFKFKLDDGKLNESVQNITYKDGKFNCSWRSVRPLPSESGFFENVWKSYRENKNIY